MTRYAASHIGVFCKGCEYLPSQTAGSASGAGLMPVKVRVPRTREKYLDSCVRRNDGKIPLYPPFGKGGDTKATRRFHAVSRVTSRDLRPRRGNGIVFVIVWADTQVHAVQKRLGLSLRAKRGNLPPRRGLLRRSAPRNDTLCRQPYGSFWGGAWGGRFCKNICTPQKLLLPTPDQAKGRLYTGITEKSPCIPLDACHK